MYCKGLSLPLSLSTLVVNSWDLMLYSLHFNIILCTRNFEVRCAIISTVYYFVVLFRVFSFGGGWNCILCDFRTEISLKSGFKERGSRFLSYSQLRVCSFTGLNYCLIKVNLGTCTLSLSLWVINRGPVNGINVRELRVWILDPPLQFGCDSQWLLLFTLIPILSHLHSAVDYWILFCVSFVCYFLISLFRINCWS